MKRVRFAVITLVFVAAFFSGYCTTVAKADNAGTSKPVAARPDAVQPVLVGQSFPKVMVKAANGTDTDLAALFAEKPSVLIFYRGGW